MATMNEAGNLIGRHSKLTPERHERIIRALRIGNYREVAARYGGVSVSTLYRWLEQGEADDDQNRDTVHRQFWEAAIASEVEAEIEAVGLMRSAFKDDWRAAGQFLERRYPARWGRRERQDVTHSGVISVAAVSPEEERSELDRMAGVYAAPKAIAEGPDAVEPPVDA